MSRAFVLGNGPSLKDTDFSLLKGERTYAVNHIWKLFERTDWRPTDYVRGELPAYDENDVIQDLREMQKNKVRIWYQKGFKGYVKAMWNKGVAGWESFITCKGIEPHPWHLDESVCGYGTVVNMAVQIAVKEGAGEIYLLGCDLGNGHFHEGEFRGEELALQAHILARQFCPVPIYNCTPEGGLDVFPRVKLEEVLGDKK